MQAKDIIDKYISFFQKQGHKRITNSPLLPQNDPTTLFTSSGMQPLVSFLLGGKHPEGKRLVNVQNCFRAVDIDEIGDNRHTTFFRMLGNWSLGDYFKKEEIPWLFEFLTDELGISAERLYVTVFNGFNDISKDTESEEIWTKIFEKEGLDPKERIFFYGVDKNWWSRSGLPQDMPNGEPGGPDTEVFYKFDTPHNPKLGNKCHPNCQCGAFMEIGNSVFMEYIKDDSAFKELPHKNVDFGGGLERLLAAAENKPDVFQTSLFAPIIKAVEETTAKSYLGNTKEMQIVADHFIASSFIISADVKPSNKEQGYILRRLIRRGLDNFYILNGDTIVPVIEKIIEQYKESDPKLPQKYEEIKNTILEEEEKYAQAVKSAKIFIHKKYNVGDALKGVSKISADDAFVLYSTHGLSPTQIKSLGFTFDEHAFARKMEEHAKISKLGSAQKFAGGLADTSAQTIMGHTATHLLHQALRDVLGDKVHQTGSNITSERIRFDFNYDKALTEEQIKEVEKIVNGKIKENLEVHFEMMALSDAKKIGAIGLFDEKYEDSVKVYFIGGSASSPQDAYSKEFCGGPHVNFTSELKRFNIIKQENLGRGQRRLYAHVGQE